MINVTSLGNIYTCMLRTINYNAWLEADTINNIVSKYKYICKFRHYLEVCPSYYEIDNTVGVSGINFGYSQDLTQIVTLMSLTSTLAHL